MEGSEGSDEAIWKLIPQSLCAFRIHLFDTKKYCWLYWSDPDPDPVRTVNCEYTQ